MFRVSARTVLELGAELISSDVIAFYELVKNAYDSGSKTGAIILFNIALSRGAYHTFRAKAAKEGEDLRRLLSEILYALDRSTPFPKLERIREKLGATVDDRNNFLEELDRVYSDENTIEIRDTGCGMSAEDLTNRFLVLGTPSRFNEMNTLLKVAGSKLPLGEKGMGRLSAMRLGSCLAVETATSRDSFIHNLVIDWSSFANVELMLDQVKIGITRGADKESPEWSGTNIVISNLNSNWTLKQVVHLCENEFSKFTDPLSRSKVRPRIEVRWNGERLNVGRMPMSLLEGCHARLKLKFSPLSEDAPHLECHSTATNLGFAHPVTEESRVIDYGELLDAIAEEDLPISDYAFETLGPFEVELYWFNRQRLQALDGIGKKDEVRRLQKMWSGVMLYRDGFRVMPYGDESDDWLSLDRAALASSGYLLNKSQFVGRVAISRRSNQMLTDKTNREGMRDCDEYRLLIKLIQEGVGVLRQFLLKLQQRYYESPLKSLDVDSTVKGMEDRVSDLLKKVRSRIPNEFADLPEQILALFGKLKQLVGQSEQRVKVAETERQTLVQLAGVGLMVEVLAHELARASENALQALSSIKSAKLPESLTPALDTLRAEMLTLSKRVRMLDPVSIPARQRTESFLIARLVQDCLASHTARFKRHLIEITFDNRTSKGCEVRAVKGMIIQILENLISNSVYWLRARGRLETDFKPQIKVTLSEAPLAIHFFDNGRGISPERKDDVFQAFYTTKKAALARGLGLYIARECAVANRCTLELGESRWEETGRLHTFVLTFPEEAVAR